MKYNKEFWNLYMIDTTYAAAISILWSVTLPIYTKLGFTFMDLLIYSLFYFITPLILLPFISNFNTRKFIIVNLFLRSLTALVLWKFYFGKYQLYFLGMLVSLSLVFHYVPYNALILVRSKKKKAELSTVYFAAGPFLGIFLPPLAGWIAQNYSFKVNIILTMLLLFIPFYFTLKIKPKVINSNLNKSLSCIKGLKTLFFIEGFWEAAPFVLVPIWILYFLKEPLQYGAYSSYLAILGVIASFIVAKISDKIKRRAFVIYPITIFLAIATFLLGFSKSLAMFSLLMVGMSLATTLAWPFMVTVYLDRAKDIAKGSAAREFMLNLGRVCSVSLLIAIYYFTQNLLYGFFVLGIAYLLYPLALWMKNHYR